MVDGHPGRAAITGTGAICAAGGNVAEVLKAFRGAERGALPVTRFSTQLGYPVFEVLDELIPRHLRKLNQRTLALTLCALEEALAEAGWEARAFGALRVGVCLGTTVASQLNDLDFYRQLRSTGTAPMEPIDRYLNGNLAEAVARHLGVQGPCATVVNACSSGTDAIGLALSWLRAGMCELAIAGGADEMNLIPYCGFASLGVMSPVSCRPFDRDRKGLNLGEGAGVLVLESDAVCRLRGRVPGLFVGGYGSAGDAHHMTAPQPEGLWLESAIRRALDEVGVSPAEVGFVNAHGTATRDNDRVEGAVLARVFGPQVAVVGTKGYTGHTLGAAGGLEAVFTAAALREGWIPATAGFASRDEEIPLSPVRTETPVHAAYAVSTSLAFGGSNSAIVFGCVPGSTC